MEFKVDIGDFGQFGCRSVSFFRSSSRFILEGPKGCVPHLRKRVQQQGFAVIVVAEGAGEEILGVSAEKDASGNKKLPPLGPFLQKAVTEYFGKSRYYYILFCIGTEMSRLTTKKTCPKSPHELTLPFCPPLAHPITSMLLRYGIQ
jgi:hypothetical protein